jgi:hypothetical protein
MDTEILREGETIEQAKERLEKCRLFDLLDLGYCRPTPLKLFGYSIFNRGEKEMATGYYYNENNDMGDSESNPSLFIINFDTNNEGDGIGFVEPIDHDGIKTQISYARSREFDSKYIIPFDPVYSYLVYNGDILPFGSRVHGVERESLGFEEFSGKLEKIDLEKDLGWVFGPAKNMAYQAETEKILDTVKKTGMAEITDGWRVYTKEYIEQGKIKNLKDQSPFTLNRMVTMKDGTKCPFVILPADLSGAYDIWKFPIEKMAHYQIFSILVNGEPDPLNDL